MADISQPDKTTARIFPLALSYWEMRVAALFAASHLVSSMRLAVAKGEGGTLYDSALLELVNSLEFALVTMAPLEGSQQPNPTPSGTNTGPEVPLWFRIGDLRTIDLVAKRGLTDISIEVNNWYGIEWDPFSGEKLPPGEYPSLPRCLCTTLWILSEKVSATITFVARILRETLDR